MQVQTCCPQCQTPVTTNVPGVAGASAFTFTTANIVVPAINATVVVPVLDTSWMVVGEYVVLPGPANFQITAINPTASTATLTFLGITGDISAGSTINLNSTVSPTGQPGAAGTNGANAFTLLTAPLTLPAVNSSVTATVGNSTQFADGQQIFISDGSGDVGNFTITGFPSSTQLTLTFLGNTGDSAPATVINSGASVVPTGKQGVAGITAAATIDTALAGSQGLSTTPTQALSVALALAAGIGHNYVLFCRIMLEYSGATFASARTVTLTLMQTNGSPAAVTNGVATVQTLVTSTATEGAGEINLVIPYTTTTAADNIEPFVSVSVAPSAGALNVVEVFLTALQLS
jgi:hypothetical protein